MNEERIKLTDSPLDIVVKMCEGNPGAINTLFQMLEPNGIDPDDAMGGYGAILMLDSIGIYGTDIYVLYSDICGKDLAKMLAVLRAVQFGFFDRCVLKDAAHRQDYSGREMVPVDELYAKVIEKLPRFDFSRRIAEKTPEYAGVSMTPISNPNPIVNN